MDHFWAHFGGHFGTRSAQEGAKMRPRRPSRASKTRKAAFAKTLKNHWFFKVFGVQRLPKRASGGPRRLQRGTQRASEPNKKGIQKWTPKLPIFGPVLGPFWGPFWGQKLLQKGAKNGTKNLTIFGSKTTIAQIRPRWPKMAPEQGLCSFLLSLAPLNDHKKYC